MNKVLDSVLHLATLDQVVYSICQSTHQTWIDPFSDFCYNYQNANGVVVIACRTFNQNVGGGLPLLGQWGLVIWGRVVHVIQFTLYNLNP